MRMQSRILTLKVEAVKRHVQPQKGPDVQLKVYSSCVQDFWWTLYGPQNLLILGLDEKDVDLLLNRQENTVHAPKR